MWYPMRIRQDTSCKFPGDSPCGVFNYFITSMKHTQAICLKNYPVAIFTREYTDLACSFKARYHNLRLGYDGTIPYFYLVRQRPWDL